MLIVVILHRHIDAHSLSQNKNFIETSRIMQVIMKSPKKLFMAEILHQLRLVVYPIMHPRCRISEPSTESHQTILNNTKQY